MIFMKDFVINSDLINEWNWGKNNELGLYPDQITLGSGKIVWWTCSKEHAYCMRVYTRSPNHNNCPYCLGKKVLVGFNDLETVNPGLASEWNYLKNHDLKPTMVTGVCSKSVWWKCKHGHEWQAKISNRANGNGCPYCADYYILAGYNDLTTTRPDLVEEWCYSKNKDILPTQISRGCNKKVWWKCKKCGYEWQASPNSRDNMNSGCPECTKGLRVSTQETTIYYYIHEYFNDAIQSYSNRSIGITELDVYVPSLSIGIEYDGTRWHQDIEHDKKKDVACQNNNINLIRVREPKCPEYVSSCFFIHLDDRSKETLSNSCKYILELLGIDCPDVDLERDKLKFTIQN
jgi:hypothetical protein